ncbi:NADH ubiquinone oxidoreductase, subunit [Acetobacteraceae bacterium AT-5844]|nr:NADH ubiquinone oxidoreductase, subunit [Acetobacteraceae bacterium AT-5844]
MLWPKLLRSLLRPDHAATTPEPHPDTVAALAARMGEAAQARLGRSLGILVVEAGGCGACAAEVRALEGIAYDMERFGLRFVTTPRQADVLVVTGPATRNMTEALQRAWEAMPEPKWVVAAGDCAAGSGPFQGGYAVEEGGVGAVLPLDLVIPGCPPQPSLVLEGLLALLEAQARED